MFTLLSEYSEAVFTLNNLYIKVYRWYTTPDGNLTTIPPG